MDPIAAAGSFATIVGLLADFAAHRADQKNAELSEFIEWLRFHGHDDVLAAIEANHATAISIKAALAEGNRQLSERLNAIERGLADLCEQHGPFARLASSLYPKIPIDFFEHVAPGIPRERFVQILGAAHKVSGNSWWYRCPDALIQIEFYEKGGANSVALALTDASPQSGFSLPMFAKSIGKLTLADVMEEDGRFRYRSSLRTEELLVETRIGPPGAWKNYTFGVLRPLAPGSLAEREFDWDYDNKKLRSDPATILINWVGLSESSEELWFAWSVALP